MSQKKFKKNNLFLLIIIKLILITLISSAYFYIHSEFKNTIPLLAVNEQENGKITGGSIIDLSLKVKPGIGRIFVNLGTIEDVDTQISIINSQKIACDIFKLNCQDYDFYYTFDSNSLLLKGPSASTAIAILTAKTIKKESIDKNTVITGSLNSGGVIGNVGGVDEKIKVAKSKGFTKVLIPYFSKYNITNNDNNKINIIKVLDLVEAYNNFGNDKYTIKYYNINKSKYEILMEKLSSNLCKKTEELKQNINFTRINKNSSEYIYLKTANNSENQSIQADKNNNYYSKGSFCYSANINYFALNIIEKNLSINELDRRIKKLRNEINLKSNYISSDEFKKNILTINDFYTYLILNNRINEAKEFLDLSDKIIYEKNMNSTVLNKSFLNQTKQNNLSNSANSTLENITKIDRLNIINDYKYKQKVNLYSTAVQRFYTIDLWASFIEHSGTKIQFNSNKIRSVCENINREILIKSELLNKYSIHYLDEEIKKQSIYNNEFTNQYLCIYNGFELNGKINTVLNSAGIGQNNSKNYSLKLFNFTKSKLSLNSKGDFPLIPFIYTEYAGDLVNQNGFNSMLYSNYALSYLDLNLFLEDKSNSKSIFNTVLEESFNNKIFFIGLLFLVAFIGY